MKSYQEMSKEELLQEKESLKAAYKEYQKMDLSLNMAEENRQSSSWIWSWIF